MAKGWVLMSHLEHLIIVGVLTIYMVIFIVILVGLILWEWEDKS